MPDFAVPNLDGLSSIRFLSLAVTASIDLSNDQFLQLSTLFGVDKPAHHASFAIGEKAGTADVEVYGFLGLHAANADAPSDEQEDANLHYELELRLLDRPRDRPSLSKEWEALVAAASDLRLVHTASVQLRAEASLDAVLPVKLPISLAGLDAPGFSEIRGVRLVCLDEGRENELYSLVIDQRSKATLLNAVAPVETNLDGRLLITAFERASAIIQLTTERVG